ncbi:MAG: translation initiation factor IF-5A [Candidatus Altiarchaeota archaeon]
MNRKIEEIKDLKVGRYVVIDDLPCRVTSITKSKPGKHGGAKAQIVAEDIFNGNKKTLMGPVGEKVEVPIINKKSAQVLNVIGDNVQLMDLETYETFELPMPSERELKDAMTEGREVLFMDVEGKRKILQAKGEKE